MFSAEKVFVHSANKLGLLKNSAALKFFIICKNKNVYLALLFKTLAKLLFNCVCMYHHVELNYSNSENMKASTWTKYISQTRFFSFYELYLVDNKYKYVITAPSFLYTET